MAIPLAMPDTIDHSPSSWAISFLPASSALPEPTSTSTAISAAITRMGIPQENRGIIEATSFSVRTEVARSRPAPSRPRLGSVVDGLLRRLCGGRLVEQHLTALAAHRDEVGDAGAVPGHGVLPHNSAVLRVEAVEV